MLIDPSPKTIRHHLGAMVQGFSDDELATQWQLFINTANPTLTILGEIDLPTSIVMEHFLEWLLD